MKTVTAVVARDVGARKRVALGVALAMGSLLAAESHAQLEEVIVTAERRETTLQQTPISIAAFSAETLELKGVETMDDVATFTPNLDIKGSRGTGNSSPTYQIRGLSGGGGATGERATAMYIDGVFVPRTTGPFMSILDVERIEVLRGPQGTLFGRNSTGGAIRVFTARPGPDREGYVKLTAGNFDRADLTAMINVPISDQLFFRAQGASLSQDGYVTRGTQELGSSEDTIVRLQLGFEPSDRLDATLSFSSADSESDGNPQDLVTFDMRPDLNFEGNRADWISDFLEASGEPRLDPADDPRVVLDDFTMPDWCFIDDIDPDWDPVCEQTNESEYTQIDLNVNWEINDTLSLTSVTGLSEFESAGITDWVMLGTDLRRDSVESDVVYQELQLNASLGDGRLDLVTGLSYFQEDSSSGGRFDTSIERVGTSIYGPAGPPGAPPVIPDGGIANGNGDGGLRESGAGSTSQDARSYGLFANAAWHVTDRFSITPGVRFSFDDKEVTQIRWADDTFTPFEGDSTTVFSEQDWDDVDWRLTLDYDITDEHMVYLTRSKAFRAGAHSYTVSGATSGAAQTATLAVSPPFIPPEEVENTEIGFRTEWAGGRVRLNLTYFDMDYTNRQAPVQQLDSSTPTGFIIVLRDSGDVALDGIELDGQIAATDNLSFDFAAGVVDSSLADACANNGDFLFPGPVEESYTIGARWSQAMSSGADLTFSLNYAWVGEQQTHPGGTADAFTKCGSPVPGWFFDSRYELPDYGLLNGRVRYTSSDGNWGLTFFGNNLTDEVYANYATRFGGGFWDGVNMAGVGAPLRSALGDTRGRPREYGITFQYNFGGGAVAR